MGMDYQYAGSASYPRFDKEVSEIAAIFGGIKTEHLKERENKAPKGSIPWWFGAMSSDASNEHKYIFPPETDPILIIWFNDIYGKNHTFTAEDTLNIWHNIKNHPEIEDISPQIWSELEQLVEYHESWDIC